MMEPEDVKRFERHVDAMAAKANDGEGLAQLVSLLDRLNAATRTAAQRLHTEDRMSWAEIGRALGVKRQSAWERFGWR